MKLPQADMQGLDRPWASNRLYMISFFFRRSDYGFQGYEKQLERISLESATLLEKRGKRRQISSRWSNRLLTASLLTSLPCLAWVSFLRNHAHDGYTTLGYLTQTSTPFALPLLLCLLSGAIQRLYRLGERREERRLKRLEEQKKKLIKELKDSTRFDKIAALLQRFDPPAHLPPTLASRPHSQVIRVGGAGLLDSALDSVSKFAQSIMGDNPTLLAELERASRAAAQLKAENSQLQHQLEELKAKYEPQERSSAQRATSQDQQAARVCEVAGEGGDASTVVAISKSSSFASIKSQLEAHSREDEEDLKDADSKGLRHRKTKREIVSNVS